MMYVHLNLNRDNKFVGDCVVRAIAKLLNQSWERTYIDLVIQGYILADMPSSDVVWQAYLKRHGFKRYVIPNTCPDCYTVADFAAEIDGVYNRLKNCPVGTYNVCNPLTPSGGCPSCAGY